MSGRYLDKGSLIGSYIGQRSAVNYQCGIVQPTERPQDGLEPIVRLTVALTVVELSIVGSEDTQQHPCVSVRFENLATVGINLSCDNESVYTIHVAFQEPLS